jgi:hypothetical protein
MKDDLSLFSLEETPIAWRRQGEGTFFFIESKVPQGFEVRCLCPDGHFANPGKATYIGGELAAAPGRYYEAGFFGEEGFVKSPWYDSPDAAKAACDHYRRHGTFPPPNS